MCEALAAFAKVMESDVSNADKLECFKQISQKHTPIAELIKASHVKEPRGELLAACPQSETVVRLLRVARLGVKAAAKGVMRSFIPPSGDSAALVEAVFAGILVGDVTCSVSNLADATKAKTWLGIKCAAASDKNAASRANLLVVQLKALPLLGYTLMVLQPEDPTIAWTMMEVMANVARGVAARSVQETVDGLLVPLMRAYAEAFDRFQKSSTAKLPRMADVWTKEKAEPAVVAFLSLVGTAEAGSVANGGQANGSTSSDAQLKTLTDKLDKRFDKLEKKQRALSKQVSDVESDDDEAAPSAKTLANRQKKADRKAKKAKEKAEADGAKSTASAPSAAPSATTPKKTE